MLDTYIVNDDFSINPTIPTSFPDGYSYVEEVGKLITYVNSLYTQYVNLYGDNVELHTSYVQLLASVSTLQTTINSFLVGYTIPDNSVSLAKLSYDIMSQLQQWVTNYMGDMRQFVSFGLDGNNFVAYIPTTWRDIVFNTDDNGRLILEF